MPRLKEILSESHGVITYQDDVLLISIHLAGYSWLKADTLRKAMGKKIPEVMEAEKEKLIKGFIEYGKISPKKAEELWKLIEPFAAYGFNKAHAASYGRVAYQTSYMKANFPAEYMTAVLTAESGDVEKVSEIIAECTRMGIAVLPPDINECFGGFTVIKSADGATDPNASHGQDRIRFGFYTIKNLGTDISDAIIAEREEHGKFTSLSDFLTRIKHKNLNKKSLEALTKVGAFDNFCERGAMLGNMEEMLAFNHGKVSGPTTQNSLFGGTSVAAAVEFTLKDAPPVTKLERLAWEKELLGLYISGHPLDEHKDKLANRSATLRAIKTLHEGATVVAAGIIEDVREVTTKKGDRMAFIKLADYDDVLEVVIFPKLYVDVKKLLLKEACMKIKGKVSERNGEKSVAADAVKEL